MAFQLKSGEILLIDKEDIEEIAYKIIVEGSLQKTCTILRESNKNIDKANMLYNILKAEKEMDSEIRNSYLRQIGELLSNNSKSYNDLEGNEVVVTLANNS